MLGKTQTSASLTMCVPKGTPGHQPKSHICANRNSVRIVDFRRRMGETPSASKAENAQLTTPDAQFIREKNLTHRTPQ